ncbi:MAG: EamA family transporter, partial [Bacteroidales bacterium]|nr:EamA family transporter [Bacteroidales bacterium]
KNLPLTTVSTIKGSRPVFVVLFSILLFGEQLNWMQWVGIGLVFIALWLLGRTSRGDASVKARRTGFIFMGISIVTGVASALYDKHIIADMEPMFVQSWTNLFITIILALCVGVKAIIDGDKREKIRWDWTLLIVALLITGADALYFFSLKQPGALLSVISVVRRASVLVTFICGAILFKEGNIKAKALNMLLLACGVVLLLIGS